MTEEPTSTPVADPCPAPANGPEAADAPLGADVADLVRRARGDDQQAWDEIVGRFNPLVMSTVRRHRLTADDGLDVGQVVWLRLVQHLDRLREPQALAGWIRTTTARECLHVIRERQRTVLRDPLEPTAGLDPPPHETEDLGARLAREEELADVVTAFSLLNTRQRELLTLLLIDPPPSYQEISDTLGIPVGAIGPTRARAIASLRRGISTSVYPHP